MSDIEKLKNECLSCRKCTIGGVTICGNPANVFSNMNVDAEIMAVGQNPGKDEVARREPFVGPSGEFFDRAVTDVLGLSRSDFYISNCVRCYTIENRKPRQMEIDNCRDFLDREIAIIRPKIILALGAAAFRQLTGMNGIMKHHGDIIVSLRYKAPVMPLLHPSPLNMNSKTKRDMFYEDLKKLKGFLDGLRE